MKQIIVLSGKQGSGKSSCSTTLCQLAETHGYNAKVFKFADPLYRMHDLLLPLLHHLGLRKKDMTKDGELLQVLGTEYGRKCLGEDVWVKLTHRLVSAYVGLSEKNIAIIDDCRFPNEHDAFEDAVRVRLTATESTRKERCSYWRENANHPSETALDDYQMLGKFHGRFSCILSTEHVRKDVTAKTIWDSLVEGFK